jgi:selenocysteine-specific elongation factor
LKATPQVFQVYLQQLKLEQAVKITDTVVALPGFEVHFSPQQQRAIDALMARFAQAPPAPPSVKECQTTVGADTYATLLESGILKQLSADVVISSAVYQEWLAFIRLHFAQHPTLTVIEFRDAFATSRKYALAFLEYLDAQGLTLREDNFRRLKANNRQIN